jgi:tRNA1Val (adenine37-N6)-methyltransferase
MERNTWFQFKQFRIIQEQAAMKVGTDGVLLGAWARVSGATKILDVGTGTGVIALMMAQRSAADIYAVEMDDASFTEACFNIEQSPWKERLHPVHSTFQEFCARTNEKFDLVISNPPFFENVSKASDPRRSNARHTDFLPYEELMDGSHRILKENGKLAVILPASQVDSLIALAKKYSLCNSRTTRVRPKRSKPVNRFLLEFTGKQTRTFTDELVIETEAFHIYTKQYKKMTRDFYLNF